MVEELRERCAQSPELPHEVGLFVGYPLKDVVGFMKKIPAAPGHNGLWRIYGNAASSLELMNLYRRAERFAESVFATAQDLATFFTRLSCAPNI